MAPWHNLATKRRNAITAGLVLAFAALNSCATHSESQAPVAQPPTPPKRDVAALQAGDATQAGQPDVEPKFYPAARNEPLVMRGHVVHMGWTKSTESWNAGGSDYYILEREGVPVSDAHEARIIMRPTPAFPSLENFQIFAGKRVEIPGRAAGHIAFVPDPFSQFPSDPSYGDTGKVSRGGGILVDAVEVLAEASMLPQR